MNTTKNEVPVPVIAGIEITTDAEGRFNLNALHSAAVANGQASDSQRPSNFIKSAKVKDFVQELTAATEIAAVKTVNGGPSHGVWGLELVAMRYAAWLSPKFEIEVYQTFLDYRTGKLSPAPSNNDPYLDQQRQMQQIDLTKELLHQLDENRKLRAELAQLKAQPTHTVPQPQIQLLPTSTAGELALERERDQLAAMLGRSKDYATISAVERIIEREFSWHPLRKWCLVNHVEPVYLKKYGCAWPRGAWLKVYGVNLEELFG
ncbi:KilA-N domain-containing protein [Citrobacter braakii]|uniref:KilA-N domain-containing protein n=1 Tax=Citrobacter braakii TaxID=57706 RepID=UPI001FFEE43C|nr:KilA-N domain-containing protein [Citrobacter braakii]MCK2155652.1 KilA-N domain-containing protein [Citrobacter braakii]